ncbi:MAG: type secretion system family protein [Actinomycetota bacterium]|nr:type secretion system family protein [Actinomycetota bacterium]
MTVPDVGLEPSGALLGLVGGLGLWLVVVRLPPFRRSTLDARLAPYVRDAGPSRPARPDRSGPLATVERLLVLLTADLVRWVERTTGGPGTLRRRLDQCGGSTTVEQFRAEQVVWGVLGALAGGALGVVAGVAEGRAPALPVTVLVVLGILLGVLSRDRWLSTQVRHREHLMLAEFPTVAELLALSVGAGEGAVGALERVSRTCRGELSAELGRTLAEARAGATLLQALEGLASRTSLPSLARFVDGVAIAVERGTPLGDVLRAQAQDVRELTRRRLIEVGGRKEMLMMVPVVFLVLPVTVLFAVFPGFAVLDLSP